MIETAGLTPSTAPGAPKAGVRGAVKAVRLLLPVWGEPFIAQFLRISLPTLLAPGNLRAVADALPSTFVFLTNSEGAEILRAHPAVDFLKSICDVEFDIIDDLITGDNYSTTLTLGYARAVRATGTAMCDTCFFFLISDYIMADGSLGNVLTRVQSGYSGVLAGNFQVIEEDAKEPLFKAFETGEPAVVIPPRDLMGWALNYLHPMTLANTVNFPMYFSAHSNRLFWRVDEDTLIGRFYLMHMIAIRPEITEFSIGSSCDYSFIPEMCPSGDVHIVADSDEYFVVEMQKRKHENQFIQLGSTDRAGLATSLAEWTTERHRLNAHSAIVYHASEPTEKLQSVVNESREFVESIEAGLPPAQPYRDHPYWIGAISAHRREVWRRHQKSDPSSVPEEIVAEPLSYRDVLFRVRDFLFGRPTQVWGWHPRWPDYQMIQKMARRYLVKQRVGRTLVLSATPAIFKDWLRSPQRDVDTLNIHHLLAYDPAQYEKLIGRFDGCFLVLTEDDLVRMSELLDRIRPLLAVDDHLLIFVLNGHGLRVASQFNEDIIREATEFFDRRVELDEVNFVMAGWSTWAALRGLRAMFNLTMRNPLYSILTAFPVATLLLISMIGNFLGRKSGTKPVKNGLCSSIGVAMRVTVQSDERPPEKLNTDLRLSAQRFMKSGAPSMLRRAESV
jgi:hypothetical protein